MTTDPTIGSSGDAMPTDLTERLHANLDYRATRVTVAAPPLSSILHRSRRRRARRHAAGVIAGAGALAIGGLAVVARPGPDAQIETAADNGPDGTAPPGTVPAPTMFGGQNCPNPNAWYLGLTGEADGRLAPGVSPGYVFVSGVNDRMLRYFISPGRSHVQLYSIGPGLPVGRSLVVRRTVLQTNEVTTGSAPELVTGQPTWVVGQAPMPIAPAGPVWTAGAGDPTSNAVQIGGVEGFLTEWPTGQRSLNWTDGSANLSLTSRGLSKDELISVATQLHAEEDGSITIPNLPSSLEPIVAADVDYAGVQQSVFYALSDRTITVTTQAGSHEAFVAQLAERTDAGWELRTVRGQDAMIMHDLSGTTDTLTWYQPDRGGWATVSIAMNGSPTTGALDELLPRLADLGPADVQAMCDRNAAELAAAIPPPPADGSSSPWTGDGSSSPWIRDGSSSPWTGDGSSSPWIGDGSSSPWITDTTVPGDATAPSTDPSTTTVPPDAPVAPVTTAPPVPATVAAVDPPANPTTTTAVSYTHLTLPTNREV